MDGKKGPAPPSRVRASIGSAILLGLVKGRLDAKPTTLYLLTYHEGKCRGNCAFCSQARESSSKEDLLSRVTWPVFPTENVIGSIAKTYATNGLRRICIQAMNYPDAFADVLALVGSLRDATDLPISTSCQPLDKEQMEQLHTAGVDRIGIPLDAANESLFQTVKGSIVGGPYLWSEHLRSLEEAVSVFGRGQVSTHLIVGLGEKDNELLGMIQKMVDTGVYPSLFAFTPIPGSKFEKVSRPSLERYRRVQLAQNLLTRGVGRVDEMTFDSSGNLVSFGKDEEYLLKIIKTGRPFMTSGCPGCNRPYYNERPGGEIYNYPAHVGTRDAEEIARSMFRRKKDD